MARSTARYAGRVDGDERLLIERLHHLSRSYPRYGYRRIWAMLRREGWRVNRKRVQRLWRMEGLKVPPKARKQRTPGHSENSCMKRKAEHPNHVWTYDFVADQTAVSYTHLWSNYFARFHRKKSRRPFPPSQPGFIVENSGFSMNG